MSNPRIQARVPEDLKEQIEKEAAKNDKTQSEVARERIQESYDSDAADAASELADEMNQRYARPAPVAGLAEAAARANETAMYGSILALLALALSALPSLVTLAPLIATLATVVSVTVAALGVLNIITAVIGTLYRAAKIVTTAGSSSAPQSTNYRLRKVGSSPCCCSCCRCFNVRTCCSSRWFFAWSSSIISHNALTRWVNRTCSSVTENSPAVAASVRSTTSSLMTGRIHLSTVSYTMSLMLDSL